MYYMKHLHPFSQLGNKILNSTPYGNIAVSHYYMLDEKYFIYFIE